MKFVLLHRLYVNMKIVSLESKLRCQEHKGEIKQLNIPEYYVLTFQALFVN
jgi:hypothetical protein